MGTFTCLNGDNGVCAYPDRVLIVTNGLLSVVGTDVANELVPFEEAADRGEELESLSDVLDYEQLIDLLLLRLLKASRYLGESVPDGDFDAEYEVNQIESRLAGRSGVIANCSCGHQFLVPAGS